MANVIRELTHKVHVIFTSGSTKEVKEFKTTRTIDRSLSLATQFTRNIEWGTSVTDKLIHFIYLTICHDMTVNSMAGNRDFRISFDNPLVFFHYRENEVIPQSVAARGVGMYEAEQRKIALEAKKKAEELEKEHALLRQLMSKYPEIAKNHIAL